MDGTITLSSRERKRLLELYRKEPDRQVSLRAHLILLLADGRAWALICAMLYCSSATIARWKARYEAEGIEGLLSEKRGRRSLLVVWATVLVGWVKARTPRDFGYCRSRWCCATLLVVLWDVHHVKISVETVRRWLHREGMVWRRPRPVLKPKDPHRPYKLRQIRELLRDLPENETAVFQDEVDLNLNPEIGSMWMPRGEQAVVQTPGTNVKRYLAGSMNWRTGELITTEGSRRDAALFVAHLHELRWHFRRYSVIHVICDNARFHGVRGSKLVRQFVEQWGERVVLHYLPTYSPQDNPIERVWWHLREQITRNHCCEDIEELSKLTMAWIEEHGRFKIEGGMYERLKSRLRAA